MTFNIDNFSGYFLANTFLSKLNIDRDFHLIVIGWFLWNYFPIERFKQWLFEKFWGEVEVTEEEQVYTVIFEVTDYSNKPEQRSDQFLALMDRIRKHSKITSSKAVDQYVGQQSDPRGVYEVDQEKEFVICEEHQIKGTISRKVKEGEKGNMVKTTLIVFTTKLDHNDLTNWIDNITKKWREKCDLPYDPDKEYIFEIDFGNRSSYDGRKNMNIYRYQFESNVTFENTYFPGRDLLLQELDTFLEGEEEWKKRGWPWHFGIALTGIPGCGKTRILKCIANYTKRHILLIQINDDVPIQLLKKSMSGYLDGYRLQFHPKETIVVFEELADQTDLVGPRDAPIEKFTFEIPSVKKKEEGEEEEKKKEEKEKVWKSKLEGRRAFLSQFLPLLDGVNERYGGMVVITTNFIERLDNAILRPGRIDYHLHLTKGYDRESTFQLLKNFWGDRMDKHKSKDLKEEVVEKYTGADLVKECRQFRNDFDGFERKFFHFHS